jgi:hypothetical protein
MGSQVRPLSSTSSASSDRLIFIGVCLWFRLDRWGLGAAQPPLPLVLAGVLPAAAF